MVFIPDRMDRSILRRLEYLEKQLKLKNNQRPRRISTSSSSSETTDSSAGRKRRGRRRSRDGVAQHGNNKRRCRSRVKRGSRRPGRNSSAESWPPGVQSWNEDNSSGSSEQRRSNVPMLTNTRERNQSVASSQYTGEGSNLGVRTPPVVCNNPEGSTTPPLILTDSQLSEGILKILGDDPQTVNKDALVLHAAVCTRWSHILARNIPEGDRKTVYDRYQIPSNLQTLNPPEINPEIVPHLSSYHKNRDAGFVVFQRDLAHSLAALGVALNIIFSDLGSLPKESKDKFLEPLWDSGRLQAGLFCKISETRRTFIIQTLNKQFKDLTENTCPGKYLFGSELGEKIKEAKSLESMGKNLFMPSGSSSAKDKNRSGARVSPGKRGGGANRYSGNRQRPVRPWKEAKDQRGHRHPSKTQHRASTYRRFRK